MADEREPSTGKQRVGDVLTQNQTKTALWLGALIMVLDIMAAAGFTAADFNIDPRWIAVARSPKLAALAGITVMLWSHSRARSNFGLVKRGMFRWLKKKGGGHGPDRTGSAGEVQGRPHLSITRADD